MALKFLSSSGSSSGVKYFDIRLDNDYIILRGGEDEAASAQLAGRVVLCLTEALTIHHVKLTLSGIAHTSHQTVSSATLSGRRTLQKEETFFEKTWTFRDTGKGKTDVLTPDNYEWPFDVVLEGQLPESVEGLSHTYVVYRLKAEIVRKRGKDIVARKPMRIVRTLGSTALELSHAMSVENVWPNKIEYSISTPTKAVVFGSFLRVDFKLIPLLKGLVIGKVAIQLKEEQEFVVDPDWNIPSAYKGVLRKDRIIASDNHHVDPEVDEQIIDEVAEGFQFNRYLELPKSLSKCLQDCNVKGIKVRHKLKFNVQLHNPDGHVSELRANLPVSLYISPSLPLDSNNDLVDQSPQASRAAAHSDLAHTAPPVYGEHVMDQLYSAVDASGYRTPGVDVSTSTSPYQRSTNASQDNLINSADGIIGLEGHMSAAALQRRLQDLRTADRSDQNNLSGGHPDDSEQPRVGGLSRRNSQPDNAMDHLTLSEPAHYPDHTRSPPGGQSIRAEGGPSSQSGSAQISRPSSLDDERQVTFDIPSGAQTPYHEFDHFENLDKIPSYSTALRNVPPRISGGIDEILPTYGMAMSEDISSPPAAPPTVHIRSRSYADLHGTASSPIDMPRRPSGIIGER